MKIFTSRFLLLFVILFLLIPIKSSNTSGETNTEPIIVFVGDSNTAENFANESYVIQLKSIGEPWKNASLINEGHDGWGMFSYKDKPDLIEEKIINHQPDYVIIALGGNDFLRFHTSYGFDINYRYFLNTLLELDTDKKIKGIFIANIYWGTLDLSETFENRYYAFQNVIGNISLEYNLPLMDFFATTVDHPEYYLADNIHLNDLGQHAIAGEVNRVSADPIINMEIMNISTPIESSSTTKDNAIYPTSIVFVGLLVLINWKKCKYK